MADSKITQLPLSPYALDKDLMVVVTGHLEEGAFPKNTKMPLSYIRRYVVRLNLLSSQQSGIASYYNSGLNVLTTWTTGIHAVPGNNMEVQFSADTPAGNKYGRTGGTSHSGIISTTGLNTVTENLIVKEHQGTWPFSGIIYNTGLNAVEGNRIAIDHSTDSPAHSAHGGAGGKYQRGIISTTGLNLVAGEGIAYEIKDGYPHEYIVFNTNKTYYDNNRLIINNSQSGLAGTSLSSVDVMDTGLQARFNDLHASRSTQNIDMHCEYKLLLEPIMYYRIPPVPTQTNQTNAQKERELQPVRNNNLGLIYGTCSVSNGVCTNTTVIEDDITDAPYTTWQATNIRILESTALTFLMASGITTKKFHTQDLEFYHSGISDLGSPYGGNYTNGQIISRYRYDTGVAETHRQNNIDPMSMEFVKTINIDKSHPTTKNTITPTYRIYNVPFKRTYQREAATSSSCNGNTCGNETPVYRTVESQTQYGAVDIYLRKRLIKIKELNVNLELNITQNLPASQDIIHGAELTLTVGSQTNAANTLVQWQVANSVDGIFEDIPGATNATLTFTPNLQETGYKYRAIVTAANNPNSTNKEMTIVSDVTTISVNPPTITLTDLPSSFNASEGSAALQIFASIDNNQPLQFQWQELNPSNIWIDLEGQTTDVLSLVDLSFGTYNGKQYRVIVSHALAQSQTSTVSTLNVPQPVISVLIDI